MEIEVGSGFAAKGESETEKNSNSNNCVVVVLKEGTSFLAKPVEGQGQEQWRGK